MTAIHTSTHELRAALRSWRASGERIAFVPTMGNLHAGHLELVRRARALAPRVVVSIFVNALQFNDHDDFRRYPRTPEDDFRMLETGGADVLFSPAEEEVYPPGDLTRVHVSGLSDILCGAFRPGHFIGVTTVVCKLFNMVQPDVALFGLKDFQQFTVIQRMTRDLSIPVGLVGVPTVREADGVALSSRNGRLSREERAQAPAIFQALSHAREKVLAGEDTRAVEQQARAGLSAAKLRVEYFTVCRADDLMPASAGDRNRVALCAVWCGDTRLIDNLAIDD
jgi:pantoate--beta-alanine ligase